MAIQYYEQEVKSGLKDKKRLSAFLQETVRHWLPGVKKLDLTYVFCSDAYLLEMNQQYLDHDTLTDIITFDMSDSKEHLVGEIYISVERVTENASKFNVSYNQELHRVIFHGALHLCGFKDKKPADKQKMREQEDTCLKQYFEA